MGLRRTPVGRSPHARTHVDKREHTHHDDGDDTHGDEYECLLLLLLLLVLVLVLVLLSLSDDETAAVLPRRWRDSKIGRAHV